MMREMLFRGKVKWNGNHFFSGDLVEGYYGRKEFEDKYVILVERLDTNKYGSYLTEVEVFPDSVSQFTGRFDKNSQKIFEMDLVKAFAPTLEHDESINEVLFNRGTFEFKSTDPDKKNIAISEYKDEEIEVVGNILP